ncbi:peptide ABC transporter permease [Sinorhizobium meliloti CCBAU 01290]|nr:peptide ABC transporter permease [Sinorhizobium meliloti CCBAU 01290]
MMGFWTTLFCAVLGFLAAVALVRATVGKAREALLVLILLPFWTNGLVRVFSWTMVLRENGFLDNILHMVAPDAGSISILYTRYAVVLGLVHGYLPYMILTCYIALVTIDDAIIEAAASLGARWWTILYKILIPMAAPGLISGAVLIFIPVIGSFMEPRILGGRVGVRWNSHRGPVHASLQLAARRFAVVHAACRRSCDLRYILRRAARQDGRLRNAP